MADALRAKLANPALNGNQALAVWQDLVSVQSGCSSSDPAEIENGNHLLLLLTPEALKSEVVQGEPNCAGLITTRGEGVLAKFCSATTPTYRPNTGAEPHGVLG